MVSEKLDRATKFTVGEEVAVSALICGDGIDLVVRPVGGRSRTVQLTVAEARALGIAVLRAAHESEQLIPSKVGEAYVIL